MTGSAGLARALVDSDRRYFELGAIVEPVAGARLAWMAGLADLQAACVVLGAEAWRDAAEARRSMATLESAVLAAGGTRVRLYLERTAPEVARALLDLGFRSRLERGLVLPPGLRAPLEVSLQRVADEDDWSRKAILHRESPDATDGHPTDADRWVEMERRKARTGVFVPWLIRLEGTVAGTAATMAQGRLLRLKNLLVHRDLRLRGIATAAIAAFGRMAERGERSFGFFGVEGTAGEAVYRSCGMRPVVEWTEWLGPPIGD